MIDPAEKTSFSFPTQIRFGKDVIKELGGHIKARGLKAPLLVTDPLLQEIPFFSEILKDLSNGGLGVRVFSNIHKNPVKSDVLKGARAFGETNSDCIVAIGGGASMDVARGIVLAAHHREDLFFYEDAKGGSRHVTESIPYFITVPTTSGTGSEVGRSAVISDDESHQKKILFSPRLMARQVFADPMLTMELPASITAATGIDALTHHIEAYLARGFSPMCDGIALEGIRLVAQSLEAAVNQPDIENRSKMMMAALMGAVAFQKGLGVVHSTAHALSTRYDMHHGLANSIMLPHGVAFNAGVCAHRLQDIANAMGVPDAASDRLVEHLQQLNASIGLPATLSSQGLTDSGIDQLAALALDDVCHLSNPRKVSYEDFQQLYKSAL